MEAGGTELRAQDVQPSGQDVDRLADTIRGRVEERLRERIGEAVRERAKEAIGERLGETVRAAVAQGQTPSGGLD